MSDKVTSGPWVIKRNSAGDYVLSLHGVLVLVIKHTSMLALADGLANVVGGALDAD